RQLRAVQAEARGYRTVLEADLAIEWLNHISEQQRDKPWMLSLGYSSLHTPLQPPPASLLHHPDATLSLVDCGTPVADRLTELGILPDTAIDLEIGRAHV